jgi:hypothetical protein
MWLTCIKYAAKVLKCIGITIFIYTEHQTNIIVSIPNKPPHILSLFRPNRIEYSQECFLIIATAFTTNTIMNRLSIGLNMCTIQGVRSENKRVCIDSWFINSPHDIFHDILVADNATSQQLYRWKIKCE